MTTSPRSSSLTSAGPLMCAPRYEDPTMAIAIPFVSVLPALGIDAPPQIVERDAVEDGGGPGDPALVHLQEPGVGVRIGLAVAGGPTRVEEDHDRVALGMDLTDGRLQWVPHARGEGTDHLGHEGLAARIRLCGQRSTEDG